MTPPATDLQQNRFKWSDAGLANLLFLLRKAGAVADQRTAKLCVGE